MAEAKADDGAATAVAALLEMFTPNPLECRVCVNKLTAGTTALLPCCHAFHRACLKQQAEAHRGEALRCGVCGTEAVGVKTESDVEKLLKDVLAEAQVAEHVHCRICKEEADENTDAVAKCTTCNKPLCEAHRTLHKGKKFPGHVVEPLAVSTATPTCPTHSGEALKIYCVTCATVCCSLCMVKTHKAPAHDTVVLANHAPDLRQELARFRASATQRSEELVQRLVGLHETLGEVDVDVRTAKLEDDVRRTIKVLTQRLAMREEELLRELGTQTAELVLHPPIVHRPALSPFLARLWLRVTSAAGASHTKRTSLASAERLHASSSLGVNDVAWSRMRPTVTWMATRTRSCASHRNRSAPGSCC